MSIFIKTPSVVKILYWILYHPLSTVTRDFIRNAHVKIPDPGGSGIKSHEDPKAIRITSMWGSSAFRQQFVDPHSGQYHCVGIDQNTQIFYKQPQYVDRGSQKERNAEQNYW